MVTEIRHAIAPDPMSCRWCGINQREHCNMWVKSVGWHPWQHPTQAQIYARLRAKLKRGNIK